MDSNNNDDEVESDIGDPDDVDGVDGPPAKRHCTGVQSLSQILRSEPDINVSIQIGHFGLFFIACLTLVCDDSIFCYILIALL